MLTRMLRAALLAGVLAGLCMSALQLVAVVPLILKAETYENAGKSAAFLTGDRRARLILAHSAGHSPADGQGEEAWMPEDGLERSAFTSLATVGTAIGFSLMLLAVMLASGVQIAPRTAALWGLGAFLATGLAPAFGLPPELPGSAAADLLARQVWWGGTVAASALGLWLIFHANLRLGWLAGLVLLVVPHIIGAPHPHELTSAVPAELQGHFVAVSLGAHAVLWGLVGAFTGFFWQRTETA